MCAGTPTSTLLAPQAGAAPGLRLQVEALLLNDPENEEYNSIYEGLAEVSRETTRL